MNIKFDSEYNFWNYFDQKAEKLESDIRTAGYMGDVDGFISVLRECITSRDGKMLKLFVEGIPHHTPVENHGRFDKYVAAVNGWDFVS